MDNAMTNKAVEYGDRGWRVFPLHTARNSACSCGSQNCTSAAKHPRIKEWQKECSNQADKINDWWGKWPDANIGIATGSASGFFVVDIDPRHGGKESFQELVKQYGMFSKTMASNTGGGGFHLFFKENELKISNRTNVLPGIDVRGEGGYIVAPPSYHQSGAQYTWTKNLKDSAIQEAPAWLLELLKRSVKPYSRSAVHAGEAVREGGRNNFLTKEAGKLRRLGLEHGQLLFELRKINSFYCQPPLDENELSTICASVAKYPSAQAFPLVEVSPSWPEKPQDLSSAIVAPTMSSDLLPECFKPWIMDIADRMQVSPEFVAAPALVSFSSVVGRKLGIYPKQHDNWLVLPNLWGLIVARPGYFKSPTIAEAMKPLENLSLAAFKEYESRLHQAKASQMLALMELEAVKDLVKKAAKEGKRDNLEALKIQMAELEQEADAARLVERRYKTNDATVEKVARLMNENPNGLLLLRDELNGWLQLLGKAGREGDREFFLESWNGYGSYTVDRVGSGTLHVPALCLSVFGGIQPGKLQTYVEKTLQGRAEDDGLLQRFQVLIYPEHSPSWENVDRSPNLIAQEKAIELFNKIDALRPAEPGTIQGVNFCSLAQEVFNHWRLELEKKLRSEEIGCHAFESHLAKYRSLMPSLALLFWILEDPENIHARGAVSLQATTKAIDWCAFLEKHAVKAYAIGQNAQVIAAKKLAQCIEQGLLTEGMAVRSIYRKQWAQLATPHLVDAAIETLEELGWLRVVNTVVQGGKTKKIELHPKFRELKQGKQHESQIKTNGNGAAENNSNAHRTAFLGANHHQF